MQNVLTLIVSDGSTDIEYIDNGVKMFEYTSPIGIKHVTNGHLSESAANDWFSYVLWSLHSISYIERIPTTVYIKVAEHQVWFQSIIERYSYAQFFTDKSKVRAIILDNSQTYGRHQKTLSKFSI
jgi:hypothetical protein